MLYEVITLEISDTLANFGVKLVNDTTVDYRGDDWTPEFSGIYATQSADGRFGVSITGSYQERDLGYNDAGATSGFQSFLRGADAGTWDQRPDRMGACPTRTDNGRYDALYLVPPMTPVNLSSGVRAWVRSQQRRSNVITSYSIHYTKLYEWSIGFLRPCSVRESGRSRST